ncbi:CRISPR-associated protein Csx16 [Pelagibius sp. CAU 1746]|uniref:CRISPR-associated protein Csx16 n=1 Tax=Pelagibius sp. CAU 1746 TaxID=3140370 RepID=UPI00325B1E25
MTVYLVTRHCGALDWARRRGIEAQRVEHLDIDLVQQGDCILGTLPVSLAAEVCARGARYFHLTLEVPPEMRGRDLSASEMEAFGAKLYEYFVERRLADGDF